MSSETNQPDHIPMKVLPWYKLYLRRLPFLLWEENKNLIKTSVHPWMSYNLVVYRLVIILRIRHLLGCIVLTKLLLVYVTNVISYIRLVIVSFTNIKSFILSQPTGGIMLLIISTEGYYHYNIHCLTTMNKQILRNNSELKVIIYKPLN